MKEREKKDAARETPVKSVVQVYFSARGAGYAYYNDLFDLKVGDTVYVEGKLEGIRGLVTVVQHTFRIKASDYKRVIGKADTKVSGTLDVMPAHLVAFSPDVIPYKKVLSWFRAPEREDEEYIVSTGDGSFPIDSLNGMHITAEVAERGRDYYVENRVKYISVDGTCGHAIVEGTRAYEVEFTCDDGMIRGLTCDCFCSGTCKHEFAAMLQLRDILREIAQRYPDRQGGYFAAISKSAFFRFAVDGQSKGTLTLGGGE